MSIQDKIANLRSLSTMDATILSLENELTEKRAGMDEKSTLKEGLDQRVERLTQSVNDMEATRNELVGEMRETSNQIDRSREKMMRCRNEREANAVQRELEELRRVFRERDQETQKLVGLIDAARADLEKATEERDAVASQIDATAGEAVGEIRELETRLSEEKNRRAKLAQEGDPSLLRKYEAIRKRRGSGVAVARAGMCAACHISLPPMLYQRIMQQTELFQCPSCHRLLYLAPPEQPEDDASQEASAAEDGASEDSSTGGPAEKEAPKKGDSSSAQTGH